MLRASTLRDACRVREWTEVDGVARRVAVHETRVWSAVRACFGVAVILSTLSSSARADFALSLRPADSDTCPTTIRGGRGATE